MTRCRIALTFEYTRRRSRLSRSGQFNGDRINTAALARWLRCRRMILLALINQGVNGFSTQWPYEHQAVCGSFDLRACLCAYIALSAFSIACSISLIAVIVASP